MTINPTYTYFDGQKSITLPQYPDSAWTWLSGKPDSAEGDSPEAYFHAVPWLYRGVTLIADAVATMPFELMRGGAVLDTSAEWKNKIGFMPNPERLLWLVAACLTLEPEAYLFSDNAGKTRKHLRYILPSSVTPKLDPLKGITALTRPVNSVPRDFIPGVDIIYFWRSDPYTEDDTGPGKSSPGKAALMASGVIANVDEFVAGYFKRGAVKPTMFVSEGMGQADAEKLETWWKNFMGGIRNAWRTKVFNGKTITAVPVGDGMEGLKDHGLIQSKREDISTALGIPQTKLFSSGAGGLGGGGVVSQDDIRFYKETIIPLCHFIATTLNDQVFTPLGLSMVIHPETLEIFQEDEVQRAQSMTAVIGGLKDPEEFLIAANILGYELSKEVLTQIDKLIAAKQKAAEEMDDDLQGGDEEVEPESDEEEAEPVPPPAKAYNPLEALDLERWQGLALRRLEKGEPLATMRPFVSEHISEDRRRGIVFALVHAHTPEAVKAAFDNAPAEPVRVDGYALLAVELRRANNLLEMTIGE